MSILKTIMDVHLFMVLVGELMRECITLCWCLLGIKVVTRSMSELVCVLYGLSEAEVPALFILNVQKVSCTCLCTYLQPFPLPSPLSLSLSPPPPPHPFSLSPSLALSLLPSLRFPVPPPPPLSMCATVLFYLPSSFFIEYLIIHTMFLCLCHYRWGRLSVVQYLVEKCSTDVNRNDNGGRTPLHGACG